MATCACTPLSNLGQSGCRLCKASRPHDRGWCHPLPLALCDAALDGASAGEAGLVRFSGTVICGPPPSFTDSPDEGWEGDLGAGWVEGGPEGEGVPIWACGADHAPPKRAKAASVRAREGGGFMAVVLNLEWCSSMRGNRHAQNLDKVRPWPSRPASSRSWARRCHRARAVDAVETPAWRLRFCRQICHPLQGS